METRDIHGDCFVLHAPEASLCIDMPEHRVLIVLGEGLAPMIWFSGTGHVHPICEGPLFENTRWPVVILSMLPGDAELMVKGGIEAAGLLRKAILECDEETYALAGDHQTRLH